jgi:hypothetical protein
MVIDKYPVRYSLTALQRVDGALVAESAPAETIHIAAMGASRGLDATGD